MRNDLPSGTVTFLFTDIEGSTQLLEQLGPRYERVLAEHRRLIREAVSAHQGVEVDTQGDAFLCAFARASDAVQTATEAQRALASTPVSVRMGIHTGEPIRTEEGYVGVDLHRGARVMAAGHGGQVLLSQSTRDLLGDVPVRDLGEHRLKDLTHAQRLYQLLAEGLPADFPPPRTLENRPTNLPTQPTALVGRERELADVVGLLRREETRLLTLTGAGGSGKTRLALQAAAELVEEFGDGAFFVNLAALNDPELVVPTIAQTLALNEQPGETIAATLARHLAGKQLLLLLDNFEQVAEAAPALAELIRAGSELKLLVTSRASLHLSGEREYPVPPLAASEALSLFAERAQAVKPTFALNGNRALVAEICRRLDNLPLALELAAARIKLLPEKALLERLDERLKLLTGGARDLAERQRTLRATIDWSYQLLSEDEQRLFARLSVFAGGRTLDAIEAVCSAEGEVDVFDGIASLVDKSLLRQEESLDGEPRFVMLETIHEYARERLEESGEADELLQRHAEHFLRFARKTAPVLGSSIASDVLGRLESERHNLRAADELFERRRDWPAVLALAVALGRFLFIRGELSESRSRLELALANTDDDLTAERENAGALLGAIAAMQGDFAAAVRHFEQSLASARRRNDAAITARLTASLASALDCRGEHDRSISLQEALLASDDLEPGLRAMVTVNLAYALLGKREYAAASGRASESLALARQGGDSVSVVTSLTNLALAQLALGDPATSAEHFHEALRIAIELKAPLLIAPCLVGIASIAAAAGEPVRAATLLGASEALLDEIGTRLESEELALHERTISSLRKELGDRQLTAASDEGRALDFDRVVALALGEPRS